MTKQKTVIAAGEGMRNYYQQIQKAENRSEMLFEKVWDPTKTPSNDEKIRCQVESQSKDNQKLVHFTGLTKRRCGCMECKLPPTRTSSSHKLSETPLFNT
jgi:hypothetical protein